MTRECVVQVLADAGSPRGILEAVAKRVEHTCLVCDPQLPLVTSEPFRPHLSEAILATGSEKREQASLRASRTYPIDEPQKSNSGQLRMYRHQPGRADGLETAPLLLVLFDVYGNDIRCCIRYHIRCGQWREFIKARPGEQAINGSQNAASPFPVTGRSP